MKTSFCWPVRVYYEDTDHGGVVYYANYLRFMERCRTEYLRAQGLEQNSLINNQRLLFAVRHVTINYLSPARFDDLLFVTAKINRASRLRVDFQQKIYLHDQRGATMAAGFVDEAATLSACEKLSEAEVSVIALDAESLKPKRMPEQLFKELMREH